MGGEADDGADGPAPQPAKAAQPRPATMRGMTVAGFMIVPVLAFRRQNPLFRCAWAPLSTRERGKPHGWLTPRRQIHVEKAPRRVLRGPHRFQVGESHEHD